MSVRALVIILAVGFLVRAAVVSRLQEQPLSPDAQRDYLPLTENVLQGNGFINGAGEADSRRGPGYPLLMAASSKVLPGSNAVAAVRMNIVLDVVIILIVWNMTLRIAGKVPALWAAALYTCSPLSIYSCALVAPETLIAFLLSLALLCLHIGLTCCRYRWIAGSGLLLGAAVLTRATPVLLPPVWGLWLLFGRWQQPEPTPGSAAAMESDVRVSAWKEKCGSRIAVTAVLGISAAAAVLPWTFRNWIVFEEFIPVVANGGANFHVGAPDDLSGSALPPDPDLHRKMLQLDRPEPAPPELRSKPAARDRYFYGRGMELYQKAWKRNPVIVSRFLIFKSLRLWYATHSGNLQRIVTAVNVTWLFLSLAGCLVAFRRSRFRHLMPSLLTIAYFQIVLTAMYPLARYVVGFTPCLCIMSGIACAAAQTWRQQRQVCQKTSSHTPK